MVSLSKHLIVLYSPCLWRCKMTKCLCEKVKRGEWRKHCDVALGYYWPSADSPEKASSASGLRLTFSNETAESKTVDAELLLSTFYEYGIWGSGRLKLPRAVWLVSEPRFKRNGSDSEADTVSPLFNQCIDVHYLKRILTLISSYWKP